MKNLNSVYFTALQTLRGREVEIGQEVQNLLAQNGKMHKGCLAKHQWVNNTIHKTGQPDMGEAARKIRRQLAQVHEAMAQLKRTGEVEPRLARNLARQGVHPQGPELLAQVTNLQQKQKDLDRNAKNQALAGVSV